jgi:hypothetical protein
LAKKKEKYYIARWAQAGRPSIGNVSFYATSHALAKRKADKIAVEIGLPNTPRTIVCEGEVIECISTGITPRTK